MGKPLFVQQILKARTITDYLHSKNIVPARTNGIKVAYRCPLHEGDNDPSFFVYTNKEFQFFKCFGCNTFGDFLNLYSLMEKVTLKQACIKLAKELKLEFQKTEPEMDMETDRWVEERMRATDVMEDYFFRMSRFYHYFLKSAEFDPAEIAIMEKVFEKVDQVVISHDDAEVAEIYDFMVTEAIPYRQLAWSSKHDGVMAEK